MKTGVHVGRLPDLAVLEDVRVKGESTKEWLDAFHEMSGTSLDHRALHEKILRAIVASTGFAVIDQVPGRVVGCALGVVQGSWMGIFDVVIAREARRCGHGERLVRGLMAWGRAAGASQAYLQVAADNAAALALYKKLGFHEAYGYWYRVKR
ncbi:MAG: GNAT family N-acetyltransferase [Candidatus Bipolaricaulota bacterium]